MKKENLISGAFIALIIMLVGTVCYVFKYQQAQNPSAIPPNYKLTSVAPVVSVDDKGQIFVRTDCTIEEYRNTIGGLAKEIITLRTAQQKPPTPTGKAK